MGNTHPASLSVVAVLVIAAAFGAAPSRSWAGPTPCHPVVAGSGRPVLVAGGAPLLAADSRPCPRARVEPESEPEPEAAVRFVPVVAAAAASGPSAGLAEPEPGPIATIVGDVAFEFDSARLRPEFHPVLDGLAAALRPSLGQQVALVGHTDSSGPERYNRELSLRRARAVADYLQRAGVAPERLFVAGDGEGRPIADNETAAGRAQNRRVEITAL